MTRPALRFAIAPLELAQDRSGFVCGVAALDRYFQVQAGQDSRRGVASVFVAIEPDSQAIRGFYSLAMAAIRLDALPEATARKLPRYPTLPAVRVGRLAVHLAAQGQGLAEHLLMDALSRSLRSEVAWVAAVVDAKDETARAFYARYGFEALQDGALHLYLMRSVVESVLG